MTKSPLAFAFLSLALINSHAIAALPSARPSESAKFKYAFDDHLQVYAQKKYATLMAMLRHDLSADQLARLQSILQEREVAVNSRTRPRHADYLPQTRLKFDRRIRTELGDHVADAVAAYLNNGPTLSSLAQLNLTLLYAGDPLSTEQIDRLCRIHAAHPTLPMPRALQSEAEIESFLHHHETRNRLILAEAEEVLSPTQLKALAGEMEFQFSYTKMGLARATNDQPDTINAN